MLPGEWRSEDFRRLAVNPDARQASEFFQRGGAQQIATKIASDGTIRVFAPATNTFGSFAPNGMIATFFKPTSPTYWGRQPGVLLAMFLAASLSGAGHPRLSERFLRLWWGVS